MTQPETQNNNSSESFDDAPLLGLLTMDLSKVQTREELSKFVATLQTLRTSSQTLTAKLAAEGEEDEEGAVSRKKPKSVDLGSYIDLL